MAGYNTMPKEEQEEYDIDGVASIFRNAMFGMALILIFGFLISKWFENPKLEVYSLFIAIAIGIPYLLIVSNSSKFKIKKDN